MTHPMHSEDAEIAVLGAVMLDSDVLADVVEIVRPSQFYVERHRRVFGAMVRIAERNGTVDPVTLTAQLTESGELDAAGGKEFVGYLLDAVPTTSGAREHAAIVRDTALRREVIKLGARLTEEANTGNLSVAQLVDDAEQKLLGLISSHHSGKVAKVSDLLWPAMQRVETAHQNKGALSGVTSGLKDLDRMTNGFQPSSLTILAARPSLGKTSLALNAARAATERNVPVAFFSLEMSKEELTERLIASEARVDQFRMKSGMLRDDEFARLARASNDLAKAELWIDDTGALSLMEMRSKARALKAEHGIGLVVVDYLQLMGSSGAAENRQNEVAQISRGLKALAKELALPVIALSQLSRKSEDRSDRRPQLSDLRDSGAIEQDADLVMLLHRDKEHEESGKTELIIGKQRNGPTGTVLVHFDKRFTQFSNWSSLAA